MRERTELLIDGMREARTKRGRWLALVTALAFLTGGNVFWELREIGMAVTEEDMCSLEVHEHSEECYDEDGNLICGKEEHVHTAACFSDENADLETAEIWEATLPERDGLSRQEQAALIAESQLGYTESTNNFILGEDGTQHGYTRYGAWYGNPYGEWNTMFTYFCLYYAGVSAEEIPCIGNARTWQVKLHENGMIRGPDTEAARGEVILLDLDEDGEADLTGIVTDAAETLHFIEGDLGHAVAAGELAPDDVQILGYVAIPEPDTPDIEDPEGSPPDESPPEIPDESPSELESTEAASSAAETVQSETAPAAETHEPLVTYRAEAPSGIQVSAVAAEGVFPADTVMTVSDVPREEALQAAAEGLSEGAEAIDAVAVDISFYAADGTELEPDGGVDVEITLPEAQQLAGEEFTLLHVADDGAVQTVEAEITGDAVVFTAEQFSIYIVTTLVCEDGQDTKMKTAEAVTHTIYGNSTTNSEANPYVVYIGDKLEIYTDPVEPREGSAFWSEKLSGTVADLNRNAANGYPFITESDGKIRYGALYDLNAAGKYLIHNSIDGSSLYIQVKPRPLTIYVNTNTGLIEIDKVHEYLNDAPLIYSGVEFIDDENGNHKYVKNTSAGQGKYLTYVGETIELVAFVPNGSNYRFQSNRSDFSISNAVTQYGDVEMVTGTLHINGQWGAEISIGTGNDERTFYIYARAANALNVGTHADIEISDGGKYVTSKIVTYPDGTKEMIVTEYDAYISGVNQSKLFDKSGQLIQLRQKIWDETGDHLGEVLGNAYVSSDYWKNPDYQVGDSQYEYTSAYRKENGQITHMSDKAYIMGDVGTAQFDISILLKPVSERIYTVDANNNAVMESVRVKDLVGSPDIEISHTVVEMNHRSVIDAFNKCPDHTGLDFTLKDVDFLASAIIDAQKWVDTGTLPEGAFTFELMKPTYSYMWSTQEGDVSLTPQAGHVYMAYQMNLPDKSEWGNGVDGWTFLRAINTAYPSVICNNAQKVGDVIAEYADPNHSGSYSIDMDAFNSILSPYLLDANAYQFDESGTAKVQGRGVCLIADYQMVATTTNDSAGHIRFPEQVFGETGTYHFLVRESAVGDGYLFDTHLVPAVVTVTEDSTTGQLSASIDYCNVDKNFRNTVTYRLPDTGGAGTLPYYLGGTVILAAASLLMIKKRREGS